MLTSAHAWTVDTTSDGDPLRWIEMPIAWSFDPTGAPPVEDLVEGVSEAFEAWSWVDGTHVSFVAEEAASDVAGSDHDLVNLVYFDAAWPEDETAIALASTWSSPDGTLLGFDIRLDASTDWSTSGDADAYDLQAALTHEIGHTLGLEHSELEDATMFGVHARGEDWRRVLHEDDEDALRHLYGQRTLDDGSGAALLDGGPDAPVPGLGPGSCGVAPPTAWTPAHGFLLLLSMLVRRRLTPL